MTKGSSFSKAFFKIFPPPAFLNMPYAGIDISEGAIHCIEFKKGSRKGSLTLSKYGSLQLPGGIVEAGYVKDEIALTAAIAELSKKLSVVRVKASLPEEKVYLFRTPLSSSSAREIAQNIESKLEENVPLAPANAIFNFQVIPQTTSTVSASVSVVPSKVIEIYLRAFKSAGVSVFSFETKARALSRALISPDSEETVMIIYGTSVSNVFRKIEACIVYRGIVCFNSTISIQNDLVNDVLVGIKNVIAYWLDHGEPAETKNVINRIVVCGSVELLNSVESAGSQMHIPVSAGNIWSNAFSTGKYAPPITAAESYAYAIAAGLALPNPEL